MAATVGEGTLEKFRRANMHRDDFEQRVQRFKNGQPYLIVRHDDPGARRRTWRAEVREDPPVTEWAGIIGDSLFDFRSALDHLAYDLAVAYSGKPLDPKIEERSQFPIFYRREPTPSDLERRIGAVHPEARRIIESMQPYGREDRVVLGYLEALHNFDKHRTAHVVVGFPAGLAYFGDSPFDYVDFTPLTDGQVVASGVIPDDPAVGNDPTFTFNVAFANEGPCQGYPVSLVLSWISQHIENGVFPLLAPYL